MTINFKNISIGVVLIICVVVLGLSLRGKWGEPNEADLNSRSWKEEGPFELSPERGRFALTYALIENKSFKFSLPLARFATPDLGYLNGEYVSLFAPGLSLVGVVGFLIGEKLGATQLFSFGIVSLMGIINLLMIVLIARKLEIKTVPALMGGMVFLFGTPAFSYAVTYYQHHLSTLLILLAIYSLLKFRGFWGVFLVWFVAALSLIVDYPNLALMLPMIGASWGRFASIRRQESNIETRIKYPYILAITAVIVPVYLLLNLNQKLYGDKWQIAGTMSSARTIDEKGKVVNEAINDPSKLTSAEAEMEQKKPLEWFQTRDMVSGFYTLLLSPDRGVLIYALDVILGVLGFFVWYRSGTRWLSMLAGVVIINIVIYSMWGDPWGGWAFGARYLIPTYAIAGIATGAFFNEVKYRLIPALAAFIIFTYSIIVNTTGAITSSSNPPLPEVLKLEQLNKKEEKYTFRSIFKINSHLTSVATNF